MRQCGEEERRGMGSQSRNAQCYMQMDEVPEELDRIFLESFLKDSSSLVPTETFI
jgi:hypothetical protein